MSKKFTFIVTDETVNRYGFRILTSGIDTTQFKKNPVGYFMHDRKTWDPKGDEVICRWENLTVEKNGVMMADAVFDEDNEKSMKIAKKVEKNFLRMASVGINPIETSEDKQYLLPGQTRATVTKSELIEISIVDRGGNNNALVKLYDASNENKELPLIKNTQMELKEQLSKVLNLGATDNVVDAVTALKAEADKGYKAKYEALVAANQEREKAEAIALVDKLKEAELITDEQKADYMALFDASHANAKKVVEGMLAGKKPVETPAEDANKKLADFVGGLGADGKKPPHVEKDYEWYELNDPEALLEMKDKEPEKFMKLFEESLKKQ